MRGLVACAALALVACGGQVVFVDDGGGGGGSSSSSPSSAAGTGPFEPGPVPDPRGDLCQAVCECNKEPTCVEECMAAFGAGCDSVAAGYLQCVVDGFVPSPCQFVDTCEAEAETWISCPKNLCSDGCSVAEQDCSCLRDCDDRDIQMSCTMVADAQASCDCKIDGTVVSTCTQTHLGCDLDFGCCAGAFGF